MEPEPRAMKKGEFHFRLKAVEILKFWKRSWILKILICWNKSIMLDISLLKKNPRNLFN